MLDKVRNTCYTHAGKTFNLGSKEMKKITIKDIAQEAGVSVATVSNVLNRKPNKATPSTIEKIYNVVNKYDYSSNLNARSLVTNESGMIGILYYTEREEVKFSDPFLSDVLTGIESVSKKNRKFILVHGFSNISDIRNLQQNWKLDGYIVIGATQHIHDDLCNLIKAPIVFIDTYSTNQIEAQYPRIYVHNDDFELSKLATTYLLARGHRNIAIYSPTLGKDTVGVIHERFTGFKKVFEENDLIWNENLFFDENEIEELLLNQEAYTAVLANSDLLAGKLQRVWKEHNILDKSVISFDNSFFADLIEPKLTTIDLVQRDKGRLAVQALVDSINKKPNMKDKYVIKGELIERDSVRKHKEE